MANADNTLTNVSELAAKSCIACKNEIRKLNEQEISSFLSGLSGWQATGGELVKVFDFANYYETMAFVNATAWISHREDHHPDLEVGYNKVKIRYSTHSAGGLTQNDLICAAKVEMLFRK